MATVTTLAPIAAQLARVVPLDALFPRGAVEEVLREHRSGAPAGEAELPEDVKPFFGHYCVVARAAAQLLGAPDFDSLARFHEDVEEEYMPGGPPQSPVYDSFSMQFVLGSVPQGIGNETPYSVLTRLLQRDPSRARLQSMAQCLADARFELYRVTSTGDHRADIEPVRGGAALSVRLTGPFLRPGDFGLVRVLSFDGGHFIADSPYLLKASEQDWLDHLARIVARQQVPGTISAQPKANKLSSKEQARRRQKEKAKAATSLAHIEVTGAKLRVRVNSRNRLKAAQQLVEALLGDTIERSLEAHQDIGQAVRAHQSQVGKKRTHAPVELAPEIAAQFHDAVLTKLRSTLNEAIPQFKGKTLRQLARTVKGRPDAVSWLREQERILKSNPQLAGLDLRPLWQELALPFQGLETDPPR